MSRFISDFHAPLSAFKTVNRFQTDWLVKLPGWILPLSPLLRCVISIIRYSYYPFQKSNFINVTFAIIRLDDDYDMMMLRYKINCVNILFSRNYFYCSCNKFLFTDLVTFFQRSSVLIIVINKHWIQNTYHTKLYFLLYIIHIICSS